MATTKEPSSATETPLSTIQPLSAFNTEPDWNAIAMDMDISLDIGISGGMDSTFDIPQAGFGLQNEPLMSSGDFFSQELLALGLQEPLPPQDMMDEL